MKGEKARQENGYDTRENPGRLVSGGPGFVSVSVFSVPLYFPITAG